MLHQHSLVWWIFVSGKKPIEAARGQESSNISGLCPNTPPPF